MLIVNYRYFKNGYGNVVVTVIDRLTLVMSVSSTISTLRRNFVP